MTKWEGVLSTTEPYNHVDLFKVRQGNTDETIGFQILENGKPYDLTGKTVLFCTSFDLYKATGEHKIVQDRAVIANAKNGQVRYTMSQDAMYRPEKRQIGYFEIREGDNHIGTTQGFNYLIQPSIAKQLMNGESYVQRLEDILALLSELKEQGFQDFNEWFESIKDILDGDIAGQLALRILEINKRLDDHFKLLNDLNFSVSLKQNVGRVSTHFVEEHNAFPDVSFSPITKKYYLVFRGGEKHAEGRSGSIYLSESEDGFEWTESKIILSDTLDLRDPSLTVLSDGTFMLSCFKYQKEPAIGETWVYKSTDAGTSWDTGVKVGTELLQYTTDKIVEIDLNKLLLPVYQGGVANGVAIRIYQSRDKGKSWSMLSYIGDSNGWNSSEPILYKLSTGQLICLIRTAQDIGTPPILYATSDDDGETWSTVTDLGVNGHASGMIESNGFLYTGARISSDNYEWYGRVVIYKIDIHSFSVVDTINFDLNPRKDNAYTSFASSDDRELVISYYAYEKSFDTLPEIKVVKTTFESLETESMLINPRINASQIVAPYIFEDDQQGLGAVRIIQHNKQGRFMQMLDHNYNKVLELDFTENSNGVSHAQLYTGAPEGILWIQPPGRNGGVKMLYGDGWGEVNALGALIWKKATDFRGTTSMYAASILRIPNDLSSGYAPVAVRDVGTTAQRPNAVPTGYEYFDITLGMPIWRRGGGWIDAAKNTV